MAVNEGSRVLVVDDEEVIRDTVVRQLRKCGYECDSAPDSAGAVAKLESEHFDLVLLDIKMPGGSGKDLLPKILQQYPDTAVVMLTAVAEVNGVVQLMKQGAYDYVLKPFDLGRVSESVAKALERLQEEKQQRLQQEELVRTSQGDAKNLKQRTKELHALNNLFQQFLNEDFSVREQKYMEARSNGSQELSGQT